MNNTQEDSPGSPGRFELGKDIDQLEVFDDRASDGCSDREVDEDEDEERAVADFVSELDLHHGRV